MSTAKEQKIIDALEPLAASAGFDLVDVEVKGQGRASVVRVLLDKQGLGIDDLAQANTWVAAAVEEIDPIKGPYTLEVSSPGIDRPLRTRAHFEKAVGQELRVSTEPLAAGGENAGGEGGRSGASEAKRGKWCGRLVEVCDDAICIETGTTTHRLPFSAIKKACVKAEVDFKRKED
jgi:ribosome maturation factor RimP